MRVRAASLTTLSASVFLDLAGGQLPTSSMWSFPFSPLPKGFASTRSAGAHSTGGDHRSWAERIDNLGPTINQLRMAIPGLKLQTFWSVVGQFDVSLADLGGLESESHRGIPPTSVP